MTDKEKEMNQIGKMSLLAKILIIVVIIVIAVGGYYAVKGSSHSQDSAQEAGKSDAVNAEQRKTEAPVIPTKEPVPDAVLPDGSPVSGVIELGKPKQRLETLSPIRRAAMPNDVKEPDEYNALELPGEKYPVFAFQNKNGDTELRVYGIREVRSNNVAIKSIAGFYPAELQKDEKGNYSVTPISSAMPIETDQEQFAAFMPVEMKKDANKPESYILMNENSGIYSFQDIYGVKRYRIYGQTRDGMPGFYPCDITGRVKNGALMLDAAAEAKDYAIKPGAAPVERPVGWYYIAPSLMHIAGEQLVIGVAER